jgi:hypothetical protein
MKHAGSCLSGPSVQEHRDGQSMWSSGLSHILSDLSTLWSMPSRQLAPNSCPALNRLAS